MSGQGGEHTLHVIRHSPFDEGPPQICALAFFISETCQSPGARGGATSHWRPPNHSGGPSVHYFRLLPAISPVQWNEAPEVLKLIPLFERLTCDRCRTALPWDLARGDPNHRQNGTMGARGASMALRPSDLALYEGKVAEAIPIP